MDALDHNDLWAVIELLLPPEPNKPEGGRPRRLDRAALAGIILQWKHMPYGADDSSLCSGPP